MSRLLDYKVRIKKPYEKDNLLRAYNATLSGMSVYRAARVYSVPESTLRDRTRFNVPLDGKPGPETLFSLIEEKELTTHIKYMADIGYGYTKSNIQYLAADFAKSLGKQIKSENQLSNNWFYGFLKRCPDLKLVKPQKLHMARAKSASKEAIDKYFHELSAIMRKNGLADSPQQIFNIDETGISTEHSPPKIVCGKDSNPQTITSPRSANVTIIAGANALGNHVPPFYVFPGKRWCDDLMEGAPVGSAGRMSESGWSNSGIFETYVIDHLAKHASITEGKDRPATLILYDGHKSHLSLTLTEWARKRNVILFVLPPHTSHLTQPLDVGVFGPFKSQYYKECQAYLQRNPGISITRYEVAKLTAHPYLKAFCPENIMSAFRKSGIYPLNKHTISQSQLAPSTIYSVEEEIQPIIPTPATNLTSDTQEQEQAPTDASSHQATNSEVDVRPQIVQHSTPTISRLDTTNFLDSRKITQTVQKKQRRKFVTPYKSLTGNLLKKSNTDALSEQAKKKSLISTASTKKTTTSKPKVKHFVTSSTLSKDADVRPSTSGTSRNMGAIPVSPEMTDDSSQDSSIAEDEKCCVCHRFHPEDLRGTYHVVFVNWGKCDFCSHWTHLIYCSDVRVLRRGSVFRCPHCLTEE